MKLLMMLLLFFCLSWPAWSKPKQQDQVKPVTAGDIVAKMKFQLDLTDAQAMAVTPIVQHRLDEEKQINLEEKQALRKVLTAQQMYSWNFLQNEPPPEKKKHQKI